MCAHRIVFVDDDALPAGQDFLLADSGAEVCLFYRASAVTTQTLEDSWAAYRAYEGARKPPPGRSQFPAEDAGDIRDAAIYLVAV